MAYFLLVSGKSGICRGSSSYRNSAGWHDVMEIGRPLSGSGYRYQGRDELRRRVEVKMASEARARQISDLLSRESVLPWIAIQAAYNDKDSSHWTFFDVSSGAYSSGTDDSSATGSSIHYIFEFRSAREASGSWQTAIRTPVPRTGVDAGNVVERETDKAVLALPVPSYLKQPGRDF
jgi:hypothetical protein